MSETEWRKVAKKRFRFSWNFGFFCDKRIFYLRLFKKKLNGNIPKKSKEYFSSNWLKYALSALSYVTEFRLWNSYTVVYEVFKNITACERRNDNSDNNNRNPPEFVVFRRSAAASHIITNLCVCVRALNLDSLVYTPNGRKKRWKSHFLVVLLLYLLR